MLIASPDHWHKDHAVDAMNAGKDVYSEKPMCRLREEAPLMVKAARATSRILQIGLQQRSGRDLPGAAREVREIRRDRQDQPHRRGLARRRTSSAAQGAGAEARRPRLAALPRPRGLSRLESGHVLQLPLLPGVQRRQDDRLRPPLDGRRAHVHGRARAACRDFAGGNYYDQQDGRTAPDTCNALFEYDGFSVLFQSNAYAVAPRVRDHLPRRQGQAVRRIATAGSSRRRAETRRP